MATVNSAALVANAASPSPKLAIPEKPGKTCTQFSTMKFRRFRNLSAARSFFAILTAGLRTKLAPIRSDASNSPPASGKRPLPLAIATRTPRHRTGVFALTALAVSRESVSAASEAQNRRVGYWSAGKPGVAGCLASTIGGVRGWAWTAIAIVSTAGVFVCGTGTSPPPNSNNPTEPPKKVSSKPRLDHDGLPDVVPTGTVFQELSKSCNCSQPVRDQARDTNPFASRYLFTGGETCCERTQDT